MFENVPIPPIALNLKLNNVPAPVSGGVARKYETINSPGVRSLIVTRPGSLMVPATVTAGTSGVITAGSYVTLKSYERILRPVVSLTITGAVMLEPGRTFIVGAVTTTGAPAA